MKKSVDPSSHSFPRLYLDAPLAVGVALTFDPRKTHYLTHVLRLKTGDRVKLFNAKDGEWEAQLAHVTKNHCDIEIVGQRRKPIEEYPLMLCPAIIKKAHFDYLIEKATELGVTTIQPLLTERTQVREINTVRALEIAKEAAEQSERLSIPEILPALTLPRFLMQCPPTLLPFVCAEWGDAEPIHEALTHLNDGLKATTAIITGPEGGFTENEFNLLRENPRALFLRLGPRILRADTAALAAITLWQATQGDWSKKIL